MTSLGTSYTSNIMINWSESSGGPPEWPGLEHLSHEERLSGGVVQSGCWAPDSNTPSAYKVTRKMEPGPSQQRMVGGSQNIHWNRRFQLGIRKNFFTTAKYNCGQFPSLGIFKTQVAKALSNLVWFQSWPCSEQDAGYPLKSLPTNYSVVLFCICIVEILFLTGNHTGE